jgi:hypothetical protein
MTEKIPYDKKSAETKLNHLKKTVNKKKVPVRIYEDDGKWYLTSKKESIRSDFYFLLEFFKTAEKSKDDYVKTVAKKIKRYFVSITGEK